MPMRRLRVPRGRGGDADLLDALAVPLAEALGGEALLLRATNAVVGGAHGVGELGAGAEGLSGNDGEEHFSLMS
eukprot:CAMPEP_0174920144 /NCGR_PEP_ID=MMETSP1355-20121228/4171_1 /TAXON_ID=464990 /ORGANISM="Hemiselmis tepida, Strain CCMP443" /LENGTH=73 /DNA_ID=CAMNT_0016165457 /DNA_START=207 /DNA_END=425 /DNA_ORIENTATION=-